MFVSEHVIGHGRPSLALKSPFLPHFGQSIAHPQDAKTPVIATPAGETRATSNVTALQRFILRIAAPFAHRASAQPRELAKGLR
jgi:hypothetical protein